MSFWRQVTYGLRGLIRPKARDREIADEVEQYFEEAAAAFRARGLTPEEAKRAARLESGSMTTAREHLRSYGWENTVTAFVGDLKFAVRQLVRHPAFALTATLTLALGIGANSAIFTVVESVLLAPLPYPDAGNISVLDTHWTDSGHTSPRVTGPDGSDIRNQAQSFAAVSLYNGGNLGVELRGYSVYTIVTWADANFARVFSLEPLAGRLFTGDEAHRAALVGEQFARDNFGSPQAAVGQTLHIENEAIQITGVLPRWFDFPAHAKSGRQPRSTRCRNPARPSTTRPSLAYALASTSIRLRLSWTESPVNWRPPIPPKITTSASWCNLSSRRSQAMPAPRSCSFGQLPG